MKFLTLLCLSLLLLLSPALHAEELLKTQTSWDGGAISYPEGQAEITSFMLRIAEGQVPEFHCHPVPTFGYVLKGTVEVETQSGEKKTFKEGESVVEVMRTVHRGRAVGGSVEILVFYAGSTSLPNTVFPGDDENDKHCKH
jgi:quercetin dioxygenase-like cupin family protein